MIEMATAAALYLEHLLVFSGWPVLFRVCFLSTKSSDGILLGFCSRFENKKAFALS